MRGKLGKNRAIRYKDGIIRLTNYLAIILVQRCWRRALFRKKEKLHMRKVKRKRERAARIVTRFWKRMDRSRKRWEFINSRISDSTKALAYLSDLDMPMDDDLEKWLKKTNKEDFDEELNYYLRNDNSNVRRKSNIHSRKTSVADSEGEKQVKKIPRKKRIRIFNDVCFGV
jgi:hypothetical protein